MTILLSPVTERVFEDDLGVAATVSISRVEEGDSEIEGAAQHPHAEVAVLHTPPCRADRPDAEADLRNRELRAADLPVTHRLYLPQALIAAASIPSCSHQRL